MKEDNTKTLRARTAPRGTMARPPREAEFRLRPARPPDYYFAVTLYLDGAKRHLSKIGHLSADFRGRGIGSRLLKDLLRRADSIGKPVTLEVMHGNPARRLYLRLGFRQTSQDADKAQMMRRPRR